MKRKYWVDKRSEINIQNKGGGGNKIRISKKNGVFCNFLLFAEAKKGHVIYFFYRKLCFLIRGTVYLHLILFSYLKTI